jgi:mono/diheme cytochrome c family protein
MRKDKIPANRSVVMLTVAACVTALAAYSGCSKNEQRAPANVDSSSKNAAIDTAKLTPLQQPAQPSTAITGLALAGQKIFYSTNYGKIKDACASCHTDGQPTTNDTRLRAGHTLVGVTTRTSTWNGAFKSYALVKNAYGATMCAVMYEHKGDDLAMVIPKADIDALNAYFDAIKKNPGAMTSNLNIQWVTEPALHEEDKIDEKAATTAAKKIMMMPGDPAAGKAVFINTCQYCHEMNEKKVGPAMAKEMDDPRAAAKSVRCGSGAMPFYTSDILSDQQIADAIAYIQQQLGK